MIRYKTMLGIVAKALKLALPNKIMGYLALFWRVSPDDAGATRSLRPTVG
jgi:hypothetical protein